MDKNKFIKVLSVVDAVLIAAAIVGCINVLFEHTGRYYVVSAIFELAALVFALVYFLRDFKKDAAKHYKLFMMFYAFTYLAETLSCALNYDVLGIDTTVSATVVISMILYGNTLILAIGKDLGKKVSYSLCAVNVIAYLLPVIGCFIPDVLTFESAGAKISNVILYCTWLIMAINAFVMTLAKYNDKAIRKGE